MNKYLDSEQGVKDLVAWNALPWSEVQPCPVDFQSGSLTNAALEFYSADLDEANTRALFKFIRNNREISVVELLLCATISAFRYVYGIDDRPIALATMLNARTKIVAGIDAQRTMGNFAQVACVLLSNPTSIDSNDLLEHISQEIEAVPHKGTVFQWFKMKDFENVKGRNSRIACSYSGRLIPGEEAVITSEAHEGIDRIPAAFKVHGSAGSATPAISEPTTIGLSLDRMLRWPEYIFTNLSHEVTYLIRLHFAEQHVDRFGDRVFDIWINDKPVMTDFDILHEAGAKYRAVVKEFQCQASVSGEIKINLVSRLCGYLSFNMISDQDSFAQASICGIELLAPKNSASFKEPYNCLLFDVVRKINAGDMDIDDFEADKEYVGLDCFSYIGDHSIDLSQVRYPAPEKVYRSERYFRDTNDFHALLSIDANIVRQRFTVQIAYWDTVHQRDNITRLADSLVSALRNLTQS